MNCKSILTTSLNIHVINIYHNFKAKDSFGRELSPLMDLTKSVSAKIHKNVNLYNLHTNFSTMYIKFT